MQNSLMAGKQDELNKAGALLEQLEAEVGAGCEILWLAWSQIARLSIVLNSII